MADNYLESKFEELHNPAKKKTIIKQVGQSLDTLLLKNRSYRGYKKEVIVSRDLLERIVSVNSKIPSARNQQCLRFKLVTKNDGAADVLDNIKLGGALPELHLPLAGTEPEAFIIICSTLPESRFVGVDLGISAQSMLLKAVELGLNGIMIGAFNKAKITEIFQLPYEPLLILAIGAGAETIRITEIGESESHAYYRQEDVHYVPKVKLSDLIL
ncbi:MAG: nitroreductase family protein [Bacteroidales bacterium]|nr:nitroreductase family protein [Bacteroidales bacterium]